MDPTNVCLKPCVYNNLTCIIDIIRYIVFFLPNHVYFVKVIHLIHILALG